MAKFFETNSDVASVIEDEFSKTGLDQIGLNLRVMSCSKAKELLKVSKASPATEFLAKKEDIIQVFVYEEVFEMMDDEAQHLLAEMMFSNVSFDSEKEKINIESNPFVQIFAMRQKYGNKIVDVLEASHLAIKQAEDAKKNNGKQNVADMPLDEAGFTK